MSCGGAMRHPRSVRRPNSGASPEPLAPGRRTTCRGSPRLRSDPPRVRPPPPSRFRGAKTKGAWPPDGWPGPLDGGGGSRTRVREWILRSFYVRRSLMYSRSGGQRSARSVASRSPLRAYLALTVTTPVSSQPELSSSRGSPRAGYHRRRATKLGYAARARLSLAIVVFPEVFRGVGTSARYSGFTKHVEAVSPPSCSNPSRG